jgi:hypothetical protein
LLNNTKGNDEMMRERIATILKLVLNSFQSKIIRDSFSLDYEKYQIQFSDFKVFNPLESELKIKEIELNKYYSIENITISFIYNNYIIFDAYNSHSNIEDSQKIFEIKFKEIIFNHTYNFLYLNNTIIDYIKMPKKTKISSLRYFKDFNEGIAKPIFSETNEKYNLNEIMGKIFNDMVQNRFLNLFKSINLYNYDLNVILDKSRNISISYFDIYYPYNLNYIYINNIELPREKMEIISGKLYVYSLKINGTFYFSGGTKQRFNAYLKDGINMYLEKNDIDFTKYKSPFKVNLIDRTIYDFDEQYEYAFNQEYPNFLIKKCSEYYKEVN